MLPSSKNNISQGWSLLDKGSQNKSESQSIESRRENQREGWWTEAVMQDVLPEQVLSVQQAIAITLMLHLQSLQGSLSARVQSGGLISFFLALENIFCFS